MSRPLQILIISEESICVFIKVKRKDQESVRQGENQDEEEVEEE